MTQQTKVYLKEKFETGDKPTQQDFHDLIDSTYNDDVLFDNPIVKQDKILSGNLNLALAGNFECAGETNIGIWYLRDYGQQDISFLYTNDVVRVEIALGSTVEYFDYTYTGPHDPENSDAAESLLMKAMWRCIEGLVAVPESLFTTRYHVDISEDLKANPNLVLKTENINLADNLTNPISGSVYINGVRLTEEMVYMPIKKPFEVDIYAGPPVEAIELRNSTVGGMDYFEMVGIAFDSHRLASIERCFESSYNSYGASSISFTDSDIRVNGLSAYKRIFNNQHNYVNGGLNTMVVYDSSTCKIDSFRIDSIDRNNIFVSPFNMKFSGSFENYMFAPNLKYCGQIFTKDVDFTVSEDNSGNVVVYTLTFPSGHGLPILHGGMQYMMYDSSVSGTANHSFSSSVYDYCHVINSTTLKIVGGFFELTYDKFVPIPIILKKGSGVNNIVWYDQSGYMVSSVDTISAPCINVLTINFSYDEATPPPITIW